MFLSNLRSLLAFIRAKRSVHLFDFCLFNDCQWLCVHTVHLAPSEVSNVSERDRESIYNLCLILKLMLQKSCRKYITLSVTAFIYIYKYNCMFHHSITMSYLVVSLNVINLFFKILMY
jgi:hypothetical protein